MTFLCLDTSSRYSVVAIARGGKLICGSRCLYEKQRLEGFFDLICKTLDKAKLESGDIDGFGVGVGPGSFTGLRIGLSAVKAFSYAHNKPCYPFSSLDAIAFNVSVGSIKHLNVAVDARRSCVYTRRYRKKKRGVLEPVGREVLVPAQEWIKAAARGSVFAGDAITLYAEALEKRLQRLVSLDEDLWYPTPESIVRLTEATYKQKRTTDAFGLKAVYLYEQDCQVNKVKAVRP